MINFTRRADTVIAIGGGKFGERWGAVGRAYGMNVVDYALEWGQAADPARVAALLDAHPECALVTLSASETSSGVFHPVEQIVRVVRERSSALMAVDGITAIGVHDLQMDAWGIDLLVGGSQKAFAVPPGLAFVGVSDRAWARADASDHPRYYLDLRRERKNQAKGQTAFTPAISIVLAMNEVLSLMEAEGYEALVARHELLGRATRAGVVALGLELLTDSPTNSCTAALVPEGFDAPALVKRVRDVYGVVMAGGQDHLKPRLVRVGHLGQIFPGDILVGLGALERALADMGHEVTSGAGVAAAQRVFAGASS